MGNLRKEKLVLGLELSGCGGCEGVDKPLLWRGGARCLFPSHPSHQGASVCDRQTETLRGKRASGGEGVGGEPAEMFGVFIYRTGLLFLLVDAVAS